MYRAEGHCSIPQAAWCQSQPGQRRAVSKASVSFSFGSSALVVVLVADAIMTIGCVGAAGAADTDGVVMRHAAHNCVAHV